MTDTAESRAAAAPEIVELVERRCAVLRIDATLEAFPEALAAVFRDTAAAIGRCGATIAGPPFSRYLSFEGPVVADAGFAFSGAITEKDLVHVLVLPGGRAVKASHLGDYASIGETWEATQAWIREHGLRPAGPAWECYVTGPDDPRPSRTELYFPID